MESAKTYRRYDKIKAVAVVRWHSSSSSRHIEGTAATPNAALFAGPKGLLCK